MARLLILVALAALGWLAWRKWLAPMMQKPPETGGYERMVQCRECGVHVPAREAVRRDDADYCCEAHAHDRD